VSGKALNDPNIGNPQELPLIADAKTADHLLISAANIDDRHTAKAVVGFADGHVVVTPKSEVTIRAFTSHDLLAENLTNWPTGGDRIWNAPNPGGYWGTFFVPPPAWPHSGIFADPALYYGYYCGGFLNRDRFIGLAGVASNAHGGNSYFSPFTGTPTEVWYRIPINAEAIGSPMAAANGWVLSIPVLTYQTCGKSVDYTAPTDPPTLEGWARLSVLDDADAPIASFELNFAQSDTATWKFNGTPIGTTPKVAVQANAAPNSYWNISNRYVYSKGPNAHSLMLYNNKGNINCVLSCTDAAVNASGSAAPMAGSNHLRPTWLELRVSAQGAAGSSPGAGSVSIYTKSYANGGINWDVF